MAGIRVYVGNLREGVDERELESEFSRYGRIRSIWVARRPSGFAFVEFEDQRDAEDACRRLDGVHGWRVEVSRRPPGAGPRREGFGGGGGGGGGRGDMRCYECNELGHMARECPNRRGGGGGGGYGRGSPRRDRRDRSRSRSPRRDRRDRSRSRSPRKDRSPRRERSPRRDSPERRRDSPERRRDSPVRSPRRDASGSPPRERSKERRAASGSPARERSRSRSA